MAKKIKKFPVKKESKNKIYAIGIFSVIIVAILLRIFIPFFYYSPQVEEHLLAQEILNRDYWGLFNPFSSAQTAPPLFSCLIKLFAFESLQQTNFTLQTIPLLSSCLAVIVFYQLLKNVLINKILIFIGLIMFAFNPALINSAQALKPYSTDVLVTICLLIYFIKYNPEGYWRRFFQTLIVSISMLFSLPSFFTILGGLTSILLKDYRKFFYSITAFVLFFVFYFVYHLWGVMEAHGATLDTYWTNFFITTSNALALSCNLIKANFNLFFNPFIELCILGAGFIISWFYNKTFSLITTTTFLGLIIASYLHLYPLAPTLTLFVIPFLIILILQPVDWVLTTLKR